MKESFQSIGQHLPQIWKQPYLETSTKKALLRSLIAKVVVNRIQRDKIQTRIVWKGGATTTTSIRINVGSFYDMSDAKKMEELLVKMAKEKIPDSEIAQRLTDKGFRSPKSETVLISTIKTIRLKHNILIDQRQSHPRKVKGSYH